MKSKSFRHIAVLLILGAVLLVNACKKEPADEPDQAYALQYRGFPDPVLPQDNMPTREGVLLGRMLFYDTRLSGNNTQSCASCHQQQFAFTDTAALSIGIRGQRGRRHAMNIFNMAWNSNGFFWDGRAASLRQQALRPIEDHLEMDETLPNVVTKLKADATYLRQFRKAFGTEDIHPELIARALEQFMLTIVSDGSKYDDYVAGTATLSPEEERGRFLFFTEFNPGFPAQSGADCRHCHGGANFENDLYMNNGLDTDQTITDEGRAEVTGRRQDRAKFKVPSLRNVALTAPYMHDGRFKTLEEVIDHYNQVHNSETLDPSFLQQLPAGLQLSASDKAALVAFLKTLTDYKLINNPQYAQP
jgi:cytochrome c peroxidase